MVASLHFFLRRGIGSKAGKVGAQDSDIVFRQGHLQQLRFEISKVLITVDIQDICKFIGGACLILVNFGAWLVQKRKPFHLQNQ